MAYYANSEIDVKRACRMALNEGFLSGMELSEHEQAQIAKLMARQTDTDEIALARIADPFWRGRLVQLLDVLADVQGLPGDETGSYDLKAARARGQLRDTDRHVKRLTAICHRHRIALPPLDGRRIERPTLKLVKSTRAAARPS
ncbi:MULTISPECIES: hypothetical protein [unclassified Rhizobium]|uniref:hypothetical protein n=1 Tax=unclassified Rhizobium TaxID=2613769 RepID=UPI0007EA792D|nr:MULTISPECIES: hypothetical protein [unclassified Rhizobium]ANL12054.1 hypothetical protein AMJ98_PA00108 [Rhizobium sp. N1341]ANM42899.1 hypothetical protein AMK03_PA00108 [Rhizobium sp. N741]